jgi:hypothetical protein
MADLTASAPAEAAPPSDAASRGAASRRSRPQHSEPALPWWYGWLPLIVLPWPVAIVGPLLWPRWVAMWTLAAVIFCGCKWLTWRRSPRTTAPAWQQIAYVIAWPGLDPTAFLVRRPSSAARRPTGREWLFGAAKLVIGFVLLYGVARLIPSEHPYIVGWIGMVGTVMVLHFGSFHLLSCFWRSIGVNARPLMYAPLASVSLGELWGRRWNTAFRDLTHRFLFRPLTAKFGARGGLFVGFLFSGVVHDVVISGPSGGGYGGPSLFFILQALGMLAERSKIGKSLGLGAGWRGWLFTLLMLALPAPLLFHPPFVLGIVVPFMQAIGAI